MKITGYQLREAIKVWQLRKTAAEAVFTNSLSKFNDEEKETPLAIADQILAAEQAIVRLQVAQMQYNLAVTVTVPGYSSLTLAEVIKLAGVVGRIEKIWSGASSSIQRNNGYRGMVRDPSQDHAKPTVTAKDILLQTSTHSKKAGALRAALGAGNSQEVDIADLDAALLE